MATLVPNEPQTGITGILQSPFGRTLGLMVGVALIIGIMAGVWLWGQQPDYKVLFSNYSDKDGGSIVASLQQMNVPYKYSDGGGAILVPANMVHDARLKLASQGLPRGGNVGFELMENQKLGVSQFLEQVNFQRALEGELARSIQSLAAVQNARVHLALPKSTVFVHDQQKPTASVLLNLFPGRTLDSSQVSGIVHLVASSVPDLPPSNVTILDQNGNLLSDAGKPKTDNTLDATQLKYIKDIQQSIVTRIESIITPLVGPGNVHAEATAEIDFSRTEQAAETYKPNGVPTDAAIRSQQTSETNGGSPGAAGVPGALSNQPPVPATAPLTSPKPGTPAPAAPLGPNGHKDSTINYEVDKTIKYVQQQMGGIKRLSVAVVVNYKKETDKAGKSVTRALTEPEKAQITEIIKEAMGFNKERGDSFNLLNSPFAGAAEKEVVPEVPIWKEPGNIQMAKDGGKYLLAGLVLLYLFFGVLKPMLKKLTEKTENTAVLVENRIAQEALPVATGSEASTYQNKLQQAKDLAKSDPKVVANVVKTWVSSNE